MLPLAWDWLCPLPTRSPAIKQAKAEEINARGARKIATIAVGLTEPRDQEVTILMPDGTESIVGVRAAQQTRDGYSEGLGNGYGDFSTYWVTGLVNFGYSIRVDGYAISYCYGDWSGAFDTPIMHIIIDWTNLDWGSTWSRMAAHYHDSAFSMTETKFIESRINGTYMNYIFWIG